METTRLKKDVEYATCDGTLVKIEGDRPTLHIRNRQYDEKKSQWTDTWEPYSKTDPWGGCMRAAKPPKPHVKTRTFSVDRDGKAIGDGVLSYTLPRDIKGTWAEFLTLYADSVRRKYDEKQEIERKQHLRETREAKLRAALGLTAKDEVSIYTSKPWGSRKHEPDTAHIKIELHNAADLDDFINNVKMKAKAVK